METCSHDGVDQRNIYCQFLRMSEISNYLLNSDGHFCDVENCKIMTSLKLHTFGKRFYSCRYWLPDNDRACKFFKWLDTSICCTRGTATEPIVIAKFK
ncbi:hypothetical protein SO802_018497 [Lithocarpus litseifolius]|uniref:Zinc finger GRF-type domain-containing protein n=1 Tax=Lithocarpus litseifolius TaxID=425828 RepID=A0AAW2CNV5_9ROSI